MGQTVRETKNDEPQELTPGDHLKRAMQLQGLSAPDLAKELGVHSQTIYNVTSGTRLISSKLAVKLSKRFDRPVEFWLGGRMTSDSISVDGDASFSESVAADSAKHPLVASHILVDRDIRSLVEQPGSGLNIRPFLLHNVSPASHDLTIGLIVRKGFELLDKADWGLICKYEYNDPSLRDDQREDAQVIIDEYEDDIDYSKSATIDPMTSVGIVLREELKFSGQFCARVGGTAKRARSGLLIVNGLQVDPGYTGPMLITILNIGLYNRNTQGKIHLESGEKILSLEIVRLGQAPDKVYDEELSSRIERIIERLSEEIANIFEYESIPNENRYNVSLRANSDESFVCDGSIADARSIAVTQVVAGLAHDKSTNPYILPFTRSLGQVTIDMADAEALFHQFPKCSEKVREAAKASFNDGRYRKTLKDTLKLLELEPGAAVSKLMGLKGL